MWVNKFRLLAGGLLLFVAVSSVQAESLLPDPAWQQETLDNGFRWQILPTPQRPSDRIEVRLLINSGSLAENVQQSGYIHFLPRMMLTQTNGLPPFQNRVLWQQSINPKRPLPLAVVSYDFTLFNLSLPNNREDLLKEALTFLASKTGSLAVTPETVDTALQTLDRVVTWPMNTQDSWWRYRLKDSSLLGHDPAESLKQPVDTEQLNAFYKKWYTPDAMTLIVVGNVDSRSVAEYINKTFGKLTGKRESPAPVATLSPLKHDPVSMMTDSVSKDRLSLMWDTPWQPINDSTLLIRYWRADLAREALFWSTQEKLSKHNAKDLNLSFMCRVLYQRAHCGINIDSSSEQLNTNLALVSRELSVVRNNGLSQDEFNALIARKKDELKDLFTTYARTDTDIIINQRLRSLQNQVVDIAPEQYQKLRQTFLDSLTTEILNQDIRQQLSQATSLVLLQPKGEQEYNMKSLQATWDKTMTLPSAAAPVIDFPRPKTEEHAPTP